jgi:glycosyltransferase involved in cell wall biosynthesis
MTERTRLGVVVSHPTQYYSPWFRWLGEHTTLELRVFYLWDFGVSQRHDPHFGKSFEWDVDLLSGYSSEFVPNAAKAPGAEHFLGFNNPLLTKRLADWRPQALLLFGYKWASHIRAVTWAALNGVPLIFRGDSHLMGRRPLPFYVRLPLRLLYSRFAAFLYVGVANRQYFETFGVPPRKLFAAPHSVNAKLFEKSNPEHQQAARDLRLRLGIAPDAKIVLFAGKLVPAKQPMELLAAFLELNRPNTALVFVGDGPERESLRSRIREGAGSVPVFFLPFANQSEMPARYLLAELFVLPSRGIYETWGLAVNEAMHMGVPCLVSDLVGCQRDLVTQGDTGWVFDPTDPSSLKKTLSIALDQLGSPARRETVRRAVEIRIAGFNYQQTTEGLLSALASLPA